MPINRVISTFRRGKRHRSRKWYISGVFLQVFDWFAANSHIIWKDFNQSSTTATNKLVKKSLADELLQFAKWLDGPPLEEPMANDIAPLGPWNTTDPPPNLTPEQIRAVHLDRTNYFHQLRPYCKLGQCRAHVQRRRVSTYCSICGVFLCLGDGCFARFHELENYLFDDPRLHGKETVRSQLKY